MDCRFHDCAWSVVLGDDFDRCRIFGIGRPFRREREPENHPTAASMKPNDLMTWLDKELRKAEHALLARQQAQKTWSGGTEQEWKSVCKASGARYLNKQERTEIAAREERIAARASQDLEAIKALIEIVTHSPNDPG